MIYDKIGAEFVYNGQKYYVGDRIYANHQSDYDGLYGVILEIRDGVDKETENIGPDIYCCFDRPILQDEVHLLEERFSDLYNMQKTVDEINLDYVIMSPEMIEVLAALRPNATIAKLYCINEKWYVKGEYGHNERIYFNYREAKSEFNHIIQEEMASGCVSDWLERDDFLNESGNDSYEAWVDNEYCENRYSIEIKLLEVPLSDHMIGNSGKEQMISISIL